ncbi:MAG TPA: universal stress protein [Pseudonocardia sp.]|jgi:nucleotide-binding universal stress UspA family protein
MDRYPLVLIGTDGSADATAAVRIGGRVAARSGVPVKVITVGDDEGERDGAWRTATLADAEAILAELGVADVSLEGVVGSSRDILLARADAEPDSLVVVGSAGLSRATSRLVASTSNRLAHHSRADVLFAKDPVPSMWNSVALATDGSASSHQAVRRGLRLAVALGAKGRLITVAKTSEAGSDVLESTCQALGLDALDLKIEREVLIESQPGSAIIAAGWKYQVVAVGNRAMSGPERLLGSVTNKVSHGLKTNLLLVNTTPG